MFIASKCNSLIHYLHCPPQPISPTQTTIHYYISMASITSHPPSTLLLHSAKPRFVLLHLHYPHHHLMTSPNGNIFLLYWPFVRRIHPSWVKSPHKGQWRGALMFSLICAWINSWEKNPQWWGCWFETPWRPFWRHSNDTSTATLRMPPIAPIYKYTQYPQAFPSHNTTRICIMSCGDVDIVQWSSKCMGLLPDK